MGSIQKCCGKQVKQYHKSPMTRNGLYICLYSTTDFWWWCTILSGNWTVRYDSWFTYEGWWFSIVVCKRLPNSKPPFSHGFPLNFPFKPINWKVPPIIFIFPMIFQLITSKLDCTTYRCHHFPVVFPWISHGSPGASSRPGPRGSEAPSAASRPRPPEYWHDLCDRRA